MNGHVYPQVDQHDWGTTFAERPLLFHNVPMRRAKERKFRVCSAGKGLGTGGRDSRARSGVWRFVQRRQDRCDHQSSGRAAGAAAERESGSSSLGGDEGWSDGPKNPRDATCATVYLQANGMRQRQDVLASGSYISSNDRRLHFGLGDATGRGNGGDSLAFGRERNGEACRPWIVSTRLPKARGSPVHYAAANLAPIRRRRDAPTADPAVH